MIERRRRAFDEPQSGFRSQQRLTLLEAANRLLGADGEFDDMIANVESFGQVSGPVNELQGRGNAVERLLHREFALASCVVMVVPHGHATPANRCKLANTLLEETLYLRNSGIVSEYYAWLRQHPEKFEANPQAPFNRMFNAVTRGEARRILAGYGCDVF